MSSGSGLALFDTALGSVGVAWRGSTITAVQLPEDGPGQTRRRLQAKLARITGSPTSSPTADGAVGHDDATPPPTAEADAPGPQVTAAMEAMTRLLDGEPVDLVDIDVDLTPCSPFDQAVYEVTRAIGPGASKTYGDVAAAVGEPGAAQAVGRSLGANPIPLIVPCHRVLGAGGALTGFSAAGGVATKRRLLLIEGCPAVPPSLFD